MLKTPQLDTDTNEKVDFVPAKSEEELKLVAKKIQVCLYLLCFDIILLKLVFLWRKKMRNLRYENNQAVSSY